MTSNSNRSETDKAPGPRRSIIKRLTRFNLRFFLIVITAFCIWFPIRLQRAERQQKGVEYVIENGGSARYDFQYSAGIYDSTIESKIPKPLLSALGRDFFHSVVTVDLTQQDGPLPDIFANGMQVFVYPIASIISKKEPIRDLCKSLPNLEQLTVNRRNAFDKNLKHIGTLAQLKRLSVKNSRYIKDAGIKHLGGCRKLETVYLLGESKITDESLRILGDLPNLRRINLRTGKLTDTGISYLKDCQRLEKAWFVPSSRRKSNLSLSSPQVHFTDEALKTLGSLPNLKTLAIASPLFTNEGAAYLAELKKIERLVLRGDLQESNSINNVALSKFQTNKLLTEIDLTGTKISPAGVEKFSTQSPTCLITPAFVSERRQLRAIGLPN